jgi:hypothetical protein
VDIRANLNTGDCCLITIQTELTQLSSFLSYFIIVLDLYKNWSRGNFVEEKKRVLSNENRLCQLNAACEVLTAVAMNITLFWDIVMYGWV